MLYGHKKQQKYQIWALKTEFERLDDLLLNFWHKVK